MIDDTVALEALHGALYDSSLIPLIPAIIDRLADGVGFDVVASAVLEGIAPPPEEWSLGQNLSDNCREEVAFFPPGALRRQARRFPDLAPLLATSAIEARCRVWREGRARGTSIVPCAARSRRCCWWAHSIRSIRGSQRGHRE